MGPNQQDAVVVDPGVLLLDGCVALRWALNLGPHQGNPAPPTDPTDCTAPDTCEFKCTGIGCAVPAGACEFVCGGITCEAPFADNHVIYTKSLSYETLQDGFSVDVARLTDANDGQQFSLTVVVEILVE